MQRLELVGQLAGGVAHDFNNVLMAIISSAEVLRLDLTAAGHARPEFTESLDTVVDAGRRAGELTRRLLTFGRRATLEKRAVSMHGVIDAIARLLEPAGTVHLYSEPGKGTVFHLSLPRSSAHRRWSPRRRQPGAFRGCACWWWMTRRRFGRCSRACSPSWAWTA